MQSLISFQCGTLVFSSTVSAVFHSRASIRHDSFFMQSVLSTLIETFYSDLNVN